MIPRQTQHRLQVRASIGVVEGVGKKRKSVDGGAIIDGKDKKEKKGEEKKDKKDKKEKKEKKGKKRVIYGVSNFIF